jgi:hypothetical protein
VTVLGLASAKGAPGVTTTCVALTLVWPRPVLLVEADQAGGDLLAGYLAGAEPPGGGLLGLALAARRRPLETEAVLDAAIALDTDGQRRVLVAPADTGQSQPITDAADRLAHAIGHVATDRPDVDVIVDLGRVRAPASTPWLRQLTSLLLVTPPTLRGASSTRSVLGWLPSQTRDGCDIGLLLAGDGPYRPGEISDALALTVRGSVAHDPPSARALTGESPPGRGFDRSPLMRSARSLADTLTRTLPTPAVGSEQSAAATFVAPVVVGEPA